MDASEPGWQLPMGRDLAAFASRSVPGLPRAGIAAMLQSWQLWASLPGQNSIHNRIFSSTTILCKQLCCLHWSEQMHSVTPTAACDQLARRSPRTVSSRTSEDWQHSMGTGGSSSVSPLHLWGLLGDTSFPSPPRPFPVSLQGGRGCGGNGGGLISWRDLRVLQVGPNPTEVQGLHSHLCLASSGTEGKRAAEVQPSPALITLVPQLWLGCYFLVSYLFFPALLAAIKHLWLPEDVRSQPCFTISSGSLEEN